MFFNFNNKKTKVAVENFTTLIKMLEIGQIK